MPPKDMNQVSVEDREFPVLGPGQTITTVNDTISDAVLKRPYTKGWMVGAAIGFSLVNVLFIAVAYLLFYGTGVWGITRPIMWGFAIINFVWWIGIGHAGTLISAILLLMKQDWRTSINRFAEAMTLFAVACAGMFPLLHMGRPWCFYWMGPYPNTMALWPQFRSPLVWDVFAVSTYAAVSALFWFVGLIPDLATFRDRAKNKLARMIYGAGAMGWTGSAWHWKRYQTAYLILAGLSTPLVVSVHTIVSFDFTIGIIPGWHSTIFPPYFVAGAIYAGFAMVLTLMIPLRKFYGFQDLITMRHIDNMAKVMLATGMLVTYGYFMEFFMAFYSGSNYEGFLMLNRLAGPYAVFYFALLICNCAVPLTLWVRPFRLNLIWLWIVAMFVNVGMWLERFVIVVMSLHRDFVPGAWGMYYPTVWDWATYLGTIGLFFTLIFLFVRVLPAIAVSEMKELAHVKGGHPGQEEHAPVLEGHPA
ncbi:NrfD/PsrC family molybdoenzyme membrane anchor subunit [Tundrisphaera lichenicola]|uniref:NrfD/PsrC family molybdoenzyme membrane anchor subunit n=1 Tax=Tundrisphaera lichenicola TaxID=2029860 RepID=UPI003EB90290